MRHPLATLAFLAAFAAPALAQTPRLDTKAEGEAARIHNNVAPWLRGFHARLAKQMGRFQTGPDTAWQLEELDGQSELAAEIAGPLRKEASAALRFAKTALGSRNDDAVRGDARTLINAFAEDYRDYADSLVLMKEEAAAGNLSGRLSLGPSPGITPAAAAGPKARRKARKLAMDIAKLRAALDQGLEPVVMPLAGVAMKLEGPDNYSRLLDSQRRAVASCERLAQSAAQWRDQLSPQ
ncbi:MAG: hypothetical protein KGO96_08425 [Elusimicrobia bacterium]|nr:hypothetical protein [Elusimicrobiota bacterium]MDE2237590.1 hypothetical protein [Elusimicrobiota bacterium]MDE2425914.1 hypothetical protein [Elusimicrobiota bacterium]